jgi:hypothetical protein
MATWGDEPIDVLQKGLGCLDSDNEPRVGLKWVPKAGHTFTLERYERMTRVIGKIVDHLEAEQDKS